MLLLGFLFCQWAERRVFASLSGQTGLSVIFQLHPSATKSSARLMFVFLAPRQGRVTPLQLAPALGPCSAPSSSCAVPWLLSVAWWGQRGLLAELFACCSVFEHTALYFLRTVCTWLHGRVSKCFCNFPACIQRAQLRGSGYWWAVCGIFREVGRYQWCDAAPVNHAEVLSPG